MSANQKAREEILSRIWAHTTPGPPSAAPPPVRLDYPTQSREELIARFRREAEAIGVKCCVASNAAEAHAYVQQLIGGRGGEVVAARRPAVQSLALDSLSCVHLYGDFMAERADISITQADYAMAETGTLVLFAEQGEGRGLSLLAPVNVSILPASRILSGLPELLAREPELAARTSAAVFITGPSRTGDIELTLSVGVHGPGELHTVLLVYM